MTTNTNDYCLVNTPQRDTVLEGPKRLPQNWQASDGTWHYNLNNDDVWTDADRRTIGWYPYTENDTGSPGGSPYYDRTLSDFSINANDVSRDAIYTQWDIERVKSSKNDELESQVDQYTFNDGAINEKAAEYVRNDVEWVAERQGELARITDWQQAADFDTTKPQQLLLTNSFVGASYVRQGLALTERNQASIAAGQGEIWEQAEINTFVSENRTAAEDSSNATAPRKPGYKIRQPIANVSEQFNRVIIYRFDVDDPNPALRRSYAMQLKNRQDNRNLYIFSYTNGTYLTWRLFELQADGVTWYLDATPAERQYVDTDMNFIFSYGTNPAVEADYFTDRISFPAGVETKNILVAWDL